MYKIVGFSHRSASCLMPHAMIMPSALALRRLSRWLRLSQGFLQILQPSMKMTEDIRRPENVSVTMRYTEYESA